MALRSSKVTGADLVATKVSDEPWAPLGSRLLIETLGPLATWDAAPWITWDRDSGELSARAMARTECDACRETASDQPLRVSSRCGRSGTRARALTGCLC